VPVSPDYVSSIFAHGRAVECFHPAETRAGLRWGYDQMRRARNFTEGTRCPNAAALHFLKPCC
jgi:hypothetical protein